MKLYPVLNGRWLKMHFVGGMKAFHDQYAYFHDVWLPLHPEFTIAKNGFCIEWYAGTDIQSPDYQCGVMFPLAENNNNQQYANRKNITSPLAGIRHRGTLQICKRARNR